MSASGELFHSQVNDVSILLHESYLLLALPVHVVII